MDFGEATRFGGSFEKSEAVSYLEFQVVPCKAENPGDCEIYVDGVPVNTVDDTALISDYFKDYSLEILYIDASHDVSNFEKPLSKNSGKIELRFHSE